MAGPSCRRLNGQPMDHPPPSPEAADIGLDRLPDLLPGTLFRTAGQFADRHPGFHPENLCAGLMALPDTTKQVSELLALCSKGGIPVVTQGGRTGLSGGAATSSGQLILDTSRMDRIESIDPLGRTATVRCGVTLAGLESALGAHGLTAGIDLAARDSATLGGMAATNAGGIEAFRNGIMRHRILGLEAVLADGSVYSHLKRVTKANEGPDIGQLFIGSEGTLGVITRLSLTLLPRDPPGITALAVFPDVSRSVSGYAALRDRSGVRLLSAEAMWPDYAIEVAKGLSVSLPVMVREGSQQLLVLLEAASEPSSCADAFEDALMALYGSGALSDVVIAKSGRERDELWRIREDSFVVDDIWPHGFWYDISVPLDGLAGYTDDLLDRIHALSPALKTFLIAHLGDGNIHATITSGSPEPALKPSLDAAVYSGLDAIGGSFSAEHGIGTDKLGALSGLSSPTRYRMMRQVKTLLDPGGIMNPGKIIEDHGG